MIPPSSINNFYNHADGWRFHCPTWVLQEAGCRRRLRAMLFEDRPTYVVADVAVDAYKICGDIPGFSELARINGEPHSALISECIARVKEPNFNVVAIGGGSTIDTAKAIVANSTFGAWEGLGYGDSRFISDRPPAAPGRFIALPTTAAAGSEVSRYFVVKNTTTGRKQSSRSWAIAPNVALLDPELLVSLSKAQLVKGAFDAFTHAWECFHCRQESFSIVKSLAVTAMEDIIATVAAMSARPPVFSDLVKLQSSAMLGGICLSNVRTGILHTAGEALASQIQISHPLSLFIFFRSMLETYIDSSPLPKHWSLDPIKFWEDVWLENGLMTEIGVFSKYHVDLEVLLAVVLQDQVLIKKEHPVILSVADVKKHISQALHSFGWTV